MSTPHQPPQGSGHQDWQQSAGPAAPYGSAPGQAYGSAPGQAYGSAPGQAGAPQYGEPSGQDQYGQQAQQAPQYGQQPQAFDQQGQAYGQPAYGSAAPQQGVPQQGAPQGFAPPQAVQQRPSAPSRPGSVMGPLSLRDLGLLSAALLALICLFLPFVRTGGFGFYLDSLVWSWSFWGMAMVFMGALTLVAAGLLTLLHKTIPTFPPRIGSFTIAQVTTVLVSVSFTANFLHIITQASYLHVGAWLLFVASLLAFFMGVFTSIPFLAAEYTALPEDGSVPPKARSAAAAPRPLATAQAYGPQPQQFAAPAEQQYGSLPQAYSSQGPAYGSHGQAYGSQGQAYGWQPQQYAAPAEQQYGSQPQAFGSQGQAYGEPAAPAPDAIAQTEQGAAQAQALSGTSEAQAGADAEETARFSPVPAEAVDADEQSTADGQTYLGRESASSPRYAQSEPTRAFAAGAFGTPEPAPQPVAETADAQDPLSSQGLLGADTAPEAADQSPAPAAEDAETPVDASRGAEADALSGAAPAATGPYVAEDTVGAEPPADAWTGTRTDGSDEPQSVDERADADEPWVDALSADAPAADERTADEPFAARPAHGEQSDSVAAADQHAADQAGDPLAAVQSAAHQTSDRTASAHVRGDEQGATENEPTQWFQVGGGASGAAAAAGGAEADSATAASDYDAAQGEPTQAFNPVASKMFWFAVPEPRPAVDPVTGQEVFTVTPNQWFLALEDHGSFFKVRDDSGQEGYLNNVERIVRG